MLVARPPPKSRHIAVLGRHSRERAEGVAVEGDNCRARDPLSRTGRSGCEAHEKMADRRYPPACSTACRAPSQKRVR